MLIFPSLPSLVTICQGLGVVLCRLKEYLQKRTIMDTVRQLVPQYIQNLQAYSSGKPIEELAREKNLDRISKLASNENPLGPSPFAIREMTNALWDTHRYPDGQAFHLKNKISEYWDLKQENIILGHGSEGVMTCVARAFIQPGYEVLTSENTFIGFYILAKSFGAKINTVPLKSGHKYDVEALKDNITENTKVIYVANPNNPTGTYITKDEFDYLMDYVPKNCLVILDEAYFEFACQCPDYPDSMDYRYDNVITTRTFSKAHGLSGIRVGYGFAHEQLIENLNKVRPPFDPNSIAQAGAVGALDDRPHLERTIRDNKELYQRTFSFLQKHSFDPIPSVTNFITFKVGDVESCQAMHDALLNHGVIVRPLAKNSMPGFVRVSIGTHEEMDHYFTAMEEMLPCWAKQFGRPR